MGALKTFRRKHKLNRRAITAWFWSLILFPVPLKWKRHWQQVRRYRSFHDDSCRLLKPKTFNQKLYYKMLYDRRPLLAIFADKLAAREYVRQKVGGDILIPLLATDDRPEEIPFEQLPLRFVLKTNHGSGYVRIVKNKSREDVNELRAVCREWLAKNYGKISGEWVYQNVPPKIMIETFLSTAGGEVASDYKFFVGNGKVFMIQLDLDRYIGHRRNIYTPDWKKFDVRYRVPNINEAVPRPANLDKC
jgi:hypothetical protein